MRFPETCRGRRAWHASQEPYRNWETLPPPEAPTAGAKRDRRLNDKKTSPRVSKSRVCGFDYRHEAEAFEAALAERMQKFGLELAADKTKRIRFGPWGGRHNGRFDFLGFEFSWGHHSTPHQSQEIAKSGSKVHRMDQGRTAQSAYRVEGDLQGQVCGPLELLWNHRKRQEPESLRLRNQPHFV